MSGVAAVGGGGAGPAIAAAAAPAMTATMTMSSASQANPASKLESGLQPMTLTDTSTSNNLNKLDKDLALALMIGLLSDDKKDKENPFVSALVAAAAIKMYENMASAGGGASAGFVGDGAGGAIGISVSVKA